MPSARDVLDQVETGATLSSGTSIAGNTAIHFGNDSSQLDSDTVSGGVHAGDIDRGSWLPNTLGLKGWWKCDWGSGSVVHDYDSVGGANNGSMNGATWASGHDGGNAIALSANTDNVNAGDAPRLRTAGDMTFMYWMYPTNISENRQNPFHKAYGGEWGNTLETGGGMHVYWGAGGGDSSPYNSFWLEGNTGLFSDNNWYHVAFVRKNNSFTAEGYVNGVLENSNTWSSSNWETPVETSNDVFIGNGYTNNLNGRLQDVRLYGRALDQSEIQDIMNGVA